jgi:hypothetical protein
MSTTPNRKNTQFGKHFGGATSFLTFLEEDVYCSKVVPGLFLVDSTYDRLYSIKLVVPGMVFPLNRV